jgi:hypothetical protein
LLSSDGHPEYRGNVIRQLVEVPGYPYLPAQPPRLARAVLATVRLEDRNGLPRATDDHLLTPAYVLDQSRQVGFGLCDGIDYHGHHPPEGQTWSDQTSLIITPN